MFDISNTDRFYFKQRDEQIFIFQKFLFDISFISFKMDIVSIFFYQIISHALVN